ncbi:unnamed protein product [Mytilus coruscus]|uniref:DDE Tnp4 domain-containing protein n=1 Tax=Mytilus coruscus TaxID=42192 RepID=A0A6J8B958_MYTCO|nr:unnamed protein product [Mytilus coruscus]
MVEFVPRERMDNIRKGRKDFKCILCEKRTKPGKRRPLCGEANKNLRNFLSKSFLVLSNDDDVICDTCRRKYYREEQAQVNTPTVLTTGFTKEAYEDITSVYTVSDLNRSGLLELIDTIREHALKNKNARIDFDKSSSLNDTDFRNLTDLTITDFEDLCSHIPNSAIRDTRVRSMRTCIGIFLTKLRSGMSNEILATLFNISKDSIRKAISSARDAVKQHFTPKYLGFDHISRESVIQNHTRPLAQTLFGDITNTTAILVTDGTYIYIQKSGQFKFQQEIGIQIKIPSFLKRNEKQLSVEDGNTTRLVTKVRWVVESVNGRIKQWRLLDKVLPNSLISYAGEYTRFVSAICNKYRPPFNAGNETEDLLLGAKIIHMSKKKNELMERVSNENLHSRSAIKDITLGVYQLKLAKSYTEEHLENDEYYEVMQQGHQLIRVRMASRHTSSKSHNLWITYDDCCIKAWYCTCKAGARIVGTCSHISSVIWFLSFYRHQSCKGNQAKQWRDYIHDANQPEVIDDSNREPEE